jgi:hypothetical protein
MTRVLKEKTGSLDLKHFQELYQRYLHLVLTAVATIHICKRTEKISCLVAFVLGSVEGVIKRKEQ